MKIIGKMKLSNLFIFIFFLSSITYSQVKKSDYPKVAIYEQDTVIMFTIKQGKQLGIINEEKKECLENNTSEILGVAEAYAAQNKLVVNEKDVLREVSKASASLKLSLKGGVSALAESVVKSKQFGLNLEH